MGKLLTSSFGVISMFGVFLMLVGIQKQVKDLIIISLIILAYSLS